MFTASVLFVLVLKDVGLSAAGVDWFRVCGLAVRDAKLVCTASGSVASASTNLSRLNTLSSAQNPKAQEPQSPKPCDLRNPSTFAFLKGPAKEPSRSTATVKRPIVVPPPSKPPVPEAEAEGLALFGFGLLSVRLPRWTTQSFESFRGFHAISMLGIWVQGCNPAVACEVGSRDSGVGLGIYLVYCLGHEAQIRGCFESSPSALARHPRLISAHCKPQKSKPGLKS